MLIKNILRIFKSYKFHLPKIVFFEIIYAIKGYRGNTFHFSNNDSMADDIPCPYFLLVKIQKIIKEYNFHTFVDLGCGSGRIIDFFNKNFPGKKFIGIEYFSKQHNYCKKIFKEEINIVIKQEDFSNLNFLNDNANCYFFNNPFKDDSKIISLVKQIIERSLIKENIIFIFVNFDKEIINNIEKIKCIQNYYINNNKGFSVCLLKNSENA